MPFKFPSVVTQETIPNELTGIPSISWNDLEYLTTSGSYAVTQKPLYTISGVWMEKFLSNTNPITCTGFNFADNNQTVVGIEFELSIQRASRIEDMVIQLTLNGDIIGENRASTVNPVQSDTNTGEFTTPLSPAGDYHVYGSATDMWGTTLTSADIANPTFGIVISFKSNPIYPHSDLAYVNQAGIRVTYG